MKKTSKVLAAILAASTLVSAMPASAAQQPADTIQLTEDLLSYAKTLDGIPYKRGGSTSKGFDASGFVQFVYQHGGIELPRTSLEMYKMTQTGTTGLQQGDLVFYDTESDGKKQPNYVGIYIGNSKFLSVSVSQGVAVQNMKISYWKSKYIGSKKVKKSAPVLKDIKVGDKINGYTVSLVRRNYDSLEKQMSYFITFKQPITVTGHYKINRTNTDVLNFFVNQKDIHKLPIHYMGSLKNGIITFQDQEQIQKTFLGINPGKQVTITINGYEVGVRDSDAWSENAVVVNLKK
ncbi:C40 family peptidase [Peribacillus sp. SCS-155]|uniref:C40 family peptidase n=1 Tax=Peribacillus sedimenti TaxID=3115297 RepID=UPI0039063CF7